MSLPTRRPLHVLLLLALVLGLLAGATGGGAQAAPASAKVATTPAEREPAVAETVAWLQRRVQRTHLVTAPPRHYKVKVRPAPGRKARWVRRSKPGPAYPGLSIDVVTALRRLDPGGTTQAAMVRALQRPAERYVSWRIGPLNGRYADATARLLQVVADSDIPVRSYADGSLRRSLIGMLRKEPGDPQRGRAVDSGWAGDTSSTVSQASVVQALAALDSKYLPMAARFLAKQSCPAGHFRLFMDSPDFTCKGSAEQRNRMSSVDATASAILALRSARSHGVKHLGDEIYWASRWLARQVPPSGGVAEAGEVNARTTALTALALKATGRLGAAGNAAAWLLRQQVDAQVVRRNPALRGQRGAIAWNAKTLTRAKREGISRRDRRLWLQSTALGAQGLSALLPERTLTIRTAVRGKRLVVRVSGLVVGERYTLKRDGRVVARGLAGKLGHVAVKLRRPRHEVRLAVWGDRKVRSGVRVVSPR